MKDYWGHLFYIEQYFPDYRAIKVQSEQVAQEVLLNIKGLSQFKSST